jgi:hypothetical protein
MGQRFRAARELASRRKSPSLRAHRCDRACGGASSPRRPQGAGEARRCRVADCDGLRSVEALLRPAPTRLRLGGDVGAGDSGDDLRTDSARLLEELLLEQEEHRPVAGELEPAVWLARVCEQLALAAVGVDQHVQALDASTDGEPPQAVEARHLTAIKLLVLAAEAIGALVQLKPASASRTESKLRAVRAIDESVEEKLSEERQRLERRTPAEWLAAVAELLGGAAAAVSVLDDEDRELPDPRDSGAVFLDDSDPLEAFCHSMLFAAVYATLACEFLYPPAED